MYNNKILDRVRDRLIFLSKRAKKKVKSSRYRYFILNEWH